MKLKRLTLHGFKSFADRTEFDFHEGLTGIIGPNGCGKSNVVDAVKWVLGDQRPTSQRGKEMMDVVFHGAEGRTGAGHAEVSLVLEREQGENGENGGVTGALPIEMSIARRLFRSGESEYLLNNQPCRLRDIKEALMDTGLGVGGYSVMEQGRIDAVLSANPEERRSIFDEAAGISRYKLRRKEALHKLDKTEQNLARVQDLRQEKASRVRSLKIQATRARSYRETSERLMALDVALAILTSIELRAEHAEVQEAVAREDAGLKELEEHREAARRELFEIEDEARALSARHGQLRDLAASLRAEERSRREALEGARARIEGLGELAERSVKDAAGVREMLAKQAAELEELGRQAAELQRCSDSVAAELPERAREAQEARARYREMQRQSEQVRSELLEAMHDRTRARNHLRDEEHRTQIIAARRSRLLAQIDELGEKLAQSAKEGAREERIRAECERRRTRLLERVAQERSRLDREEHDRDEIVRRRHDLVSERSATLSRIHLLEELEASHTGLDEAARAMLEEGHGVTGRLVEFIDCPPEVGPAVEAVLGTRLQALLVEDFGRAVEALDALAAGTGGGRLVMVDLAAVEETRSHDAAAIDLASIPDEGVPLAPLCERKPPVDGLLDDLLRDVTLVRDLDCARRLRAAARAVGRGSRIIVTLRGEVFEDAWVTGGAAEAAAGLLQRRSDLERLRGELARLDGRIDAAQREQDELDSILERRAKESERLEDLAEVNLRRRTGIEQRLQARRMREQELTAAIEQDRQELADLAEEKTACLARMMSPMFDSLLHQRRERGLEQRQRELVQELHEQDRVVHESQDRLSNVQSQKAALDAELAGLRERRSLQERTLEDLRARAGALDEQGETAQSDRERLVTDVARWRGELVDYGCRTRFVEELSQTVASNVTELESATAEQRRAAEELDAKLIRASEQRSETLLRHKELALRLAHVDDEIRDRYRIELARLRGETEGWGMWTDGPVLGPELPPDGPVRDAVLDASIRGPMLPPDWYARERDLPRLWEDPEFDRSDTQREAEVLRARMQRMGAVNLDAEAELSRVQGEYEQLERDCVDLENARKQLIEMLHRINFESRALFERTFDAARANFQEIFRKLFQGGKADIQLVESDDPLDAGIEILARPPGKELRSIRLLSGGERSLTALAILFAVFQIKPSPFCILDEVDAALDEANVERFLRVLREFVADTQFLVVTHHKRTMAECKVLYGVTMPRKGVSSRMSVSLEDVDSGEVDRVVQPLGRTAGVREVAAEPASRETEAESREPRAESRKSVESQ